MNVTNIRFEGRAYENVPSHVLDDASREVAKRRALTEGDLFLEEPTITDIALATAALVGSGLIEIYRTNPID